MPKVKDTVLYVILNQIRKKKHLRLIDIQRRIDQIFGNRALSYRNLIRIFQGHTVARQLSLYQICLALGVTVQEIKDQVRKDSPIELIRKNKGETKYIYNEKAYAEVIAHPMKRFTSLELTLEKAGETKPEQDLKNPEKWVYVLKGKVLLTIGEKSYCLKKSDNIAFDSSKTHWFKNVFSRKSKCLIIQNPLPPEK